MLDNEPQLLQITHLQESVLKCDVVDAFEPTAEERPVVVETEREGEDAEVGWKIPEDEAWEQTSVVL